MKKESIEPPLNKLGVRRQCKLLGLNRSTFYYQPTDANIEDVSTINELDRVYVASNQMDNVWIEKFWRTIKYEYIYLNTADIGTISVLRTIASIISDCSELFSLRSITSSLTQETIISCFEFS